jgi:3-hydroxyphenylacetate 6-hydroxylase
MFPLFSLTLKALGLPVAVLTFYLIFNEIVRYKNRLSGLKGPRGLPLIGNLREVTPLLPSLSLSSLLLTPSHR